MSHGHDDYQVEPIPGLPEALPAGEAMLWQGAPDWWQLARNVFHIRLVALYFAALMLWRGGTRLAETGNIGAAILPVVSLLPIALFGLGLLALVAKLASRTSIYTITNRRVVMRIGIALPTAINLPFALIAGANFAPRAAGAGDIALKLQDGQRVAYSSLWPHARPWRFSQPEPMLRGILNAAYVADILANALRAAAPAVASAPISLSPLPSAAVETSNDNSLAAKAAASKLSLGQNAATPLSA